MFSKVRPGLDVNGAKKMPRFAIGAYMKRKKLLREKVVMEHRKIMEKKEELLKKNKNMERMEKKRRRVDCKVVN